MKLSRFPTLLMLVLALGAGTLASVSLADDDDRDRESKASSRHDDRPLVIAHRGASGYRPEHTLASYELGARMGADYIEPDLVITKDGVLVARHEPEISTDDRRRSHHRSSPAAGRRRPSSAARSTGWFTEDFTLAELKTLRAKERIPRRAGQRPLRRPLPGADAPGGDRPRPAAVAPAGPPDRPVPRDSSTPRTSGDGAGARGTAAARCGATVFTDRRAGVRPVLRGRQPAGSSTTGRTPLLQLVRRARGHACRRARTDGELATAPACADRALRRRRGPVEGLRRAEGPGGSSRRADGFVRARTAPGCWSHPYTFRSENEFLPPSCAAGPTLAAYGNASASTSSSTSLGVDGLFADQPGHAPWRRVASPLQ